MPTIREVLGKFQEKTSIHLVNQGCIGCFICKEHLTQAETEIRKAILEELPKEKVSLGDNCFGCVNSSKCKFCGVIYYNQCLAQIKAKIGGEK